MSNHSATVSRTWKLDSDYRPRAFHLKSWAICGFVLSLALNVPPAAAQEIDSRNQEQSEPSVVKAVTYDVDSEEAAAASISVQQSQVGSLESCGCTSFHDTCCCDVLWSARTGALFLKRSTPDSVALMEATADPSRQLNAGQFGFDFETGWEASIRADSECRGWGLEGRFMSLDSWTAAASSEVLTDMANPLRINTNPPLFIQDVQTVNAVYATDFLSAELNLRHGLEQGLSLVSGFRYVELDESLETDLIGSTPPATYEVDVANRLYGYQLGLEQNFGCSGFGGGVTLDANVKAGIYYNNAQGSNTFDNGAVTLSVIDANDDVAFLGEIGVNAGYWLTDSIALRAGYNLLWIEGVALGTEQTTVTNFFTGQGIDDDGGLFLHGATCGLDIVW